MGVIIGAARIGEAACQTSPLNLCMMTNQAHVLLATNCRTLHAGRAARPDG